MAIPVILRGDTASKISIVIEGELDSANDKIILALDEIRREIDNPLSGKKIDITLSAIETTGLTLGTHKIYVFVKNATGEIRSLPWVKVKVTDSPSEVYDVLVRINAANLDVENATAEDTLGGVKEKMNKILSFLRGTACVAISLLFLCGAKVEDKTLNDIPGSDKVVTNVDLSGLATSDDIEAATNALMTADGMTETPPFKYTGYMHNGVKWQFNGRANHASTANRLINTKSGGVENASLNFAIVQESEEMFYTSPNRLKFKGAPANEQNENIVAYLSDFSTNNTAMVDTVTNVTKQTFGNLETKVDDAKSTATNALDKADTAKATADEAKSFADNAMLNAVNANHISDYALQAAYGAQETANTAVSMISETNETFSTAVLAVGLNIDTNSVAALNDIAETFGGFPIEGTATTVGGLLAALAAAVAWLKKNKADKSELVAMKKELEIKKDENGLYYYNVEVK